MNYVILCGATIILRWDLTAYCENSVEYGAGVC